MEQNNKERELRLADLFEVLKKCWWIMLIVCIVTSVTLFSVLKATNVPEYSSTASLYFLSNSEIVQDGKSNSAYYQLEIAVSLAEDCVELAAMEDPVLQPALNTLQAEGILQGKTTKDLSRMIEASELEESRFIHFTVTSLNPEESARICNVFTEQVSKAFNEAQTDGTWQVVQVINTAKAPTEQSNPVSIVKNGLIGIAAAMLVYALFFIFFWIDDRINTQEDVTRYLGVNVLGVIPSRDDTSKKHSKYGAYYRSQAPESQQNGREVK